MKYKDLNIIESRLEVHKILDEHIQNKRSLLLNTINANILTIMNKDPSYEKIILDARYNILDGQNIARILSFKYLRRIEAFPGPDIFYYYLKGDYKHVLVGGDISDTEILSKKFNNIFKIGLDYLELDQFNYLQIAEEINTIKPDFIWVSLGAPKQEKFAYELFKYIHKGILVPVGAAFNFYGTSKRAPKILRSLGLEWLFRLKMDKSSKTKSRLKEEINGIIPIIWKL